MAWGWTLPTGVLWGRVSQPAAALDFDAIYAEHFDFVWRSLRRLGLTETAADGALQDVFVVVHRRLSDFEGRSSLKSWLFGIALKVAKDHRRSDARQRTGPLEDKHALTDERTPEDEAARKQAVATLDTILAGFDPDRRAVFVMAEVEQMTAPEIADVTGDKLNTVYSKLRLARKDFERAVQRLNAERRRQQG